MRLRRVEIGLALSSRTNVIASKTGSQWRKDIELSPSGFRAAAPPSKRSKTLLSLGREYSHRTLFPLAPLRAGCATLHSTTRDHCVRSGSSSPKVTHKIFALRSARSSCALFCGENCALVMYAQAQWTSRKSRRSTQFIRFRTNP